MGRHQKRYRAFKTVTPSPNHATTNVASLPNNAIKLKVASTLSIRVLEQPTTSIRACSTIFLHCALTPPDRSYTIAHALKMPKLSLVFTHLELLL